MTRATLALLAWLAALAPGSAHAQAAAPAPAPAIEAAASASSAGADRSGPPAYIQDSASGGGNSQSGILFYVEKIDGADTRNNLDATRRASSNRGFDLQLGSAGRPLPAGPMRLTLTGRMVYGAPIQEMFAGSRLYHVTGEVAVDLVAGRRYRVTGVLDTFRREVWLEDTVTGQVVGTKVVAPPTRELAAELQAADRYTCCNLHYGDRWISDANFAELPFIPPGARVKITGWGRERVHVNVEGRPTSAGVDYSRTEQTREQFADRIFVRDDPRPRIASWPADVQAAIAAGKVRKGMTREQVVVSLGLPRPDRNPDPSARKLIYFASERAEFDVDFDADDRVEGSRLQAACES
ncbi:hypothetical protein [Piscinibacter koreensis]|uniref:Uncharacterized protein n=1 Tax=Piscinibacter koreensis TaxID=2742824 RepID=A0A7Y6NNV5_9BURK|nr:hypothetical protein [Schlegelella koreensis]NUZ06564.1 hypothetical protein [Schlegelella koreensis]